MDTLLLVTTGVIIGLIGFAFGEVLHTYVIVRRDASRVNEGQAIFPLGYFLVDGQTPSKRYQQRLDLASDICRRQGIPIWSLAGRLANMEHSNAYYSNRYLLASGVEPKAVRIIDEFPFLGQPVETIQEVRAAYELARRVHVRRLIVISDLLHLAQIRLVLRSLDIDPIFVFTTLTPSWTADEIRYLHIRLGMIILTFADRRGRTLGFLRVWRSGGVRNVWNQLQPGGLVPVQRPVHPVGGEAFSRGTRPGDGREPHRDSPCALQRYTAGHGKG